MTKVLKWVGIALAAIALIGVGAALGGGGADEKGAAAKAGTAKAEATPVPTPEVEDTDGDGVADAEDADPYSPTITTGDEFEDAPGDEYTDEELDPEPIQKPIAIGQTGRDDGVAFKVTSMREVQSIPTGEFSDGPVTAKRNARLIQVDLTYKNNMDVPIDLLCGGGHGFILLDENDRNFQPMDVLLDINDNVCGEDVQPGFKTSVTLAFRMPRGAKIGGLVIWNGEAEDDFSGEVSQLIVLP